MTLLQHWITSLKTSLWQGMNRWLTFHQHTVVLLTVGRFTLLCQMDSTSLTERFQELLNTTWQSLLTQFMQTTLVARFHTRLTSQCLNQWWNSNTSLPMWLWSTTLQAQTFRWCQYCTMMVWLKHGRFGQLYRVDWTSVVRMERFQESLQNCRSYLWITRFGLTTLEELLLL